jgi:hypothetical protein
VKKSIAIALTFLIALGAGCSGGSASVFSSVYLLTATKPESYLFLTERYQEGGITIEYPQLEGMPDQKALRRINRQLREGALEVLKNLDKNANAEVHYEAKMANSQLISIAFAGDAFGPGWAHPVNISYSLNVSGSGSRLHLKDFYNIDKAFVESILYQEYPAEKLPAVEYLRNQDPKELIKLFKNADENQASQVYTSFASAGPTFYIGVPHALGDWALLEVPYNSLSPYEKK